MKFWLISLAATLLLLPLTESYRFSLLPFDLKRLVQIGLVTIGLFYILVRQTPSLPRQSWLISLGLILLPWVSTSLANDPISGFAELSNTVGMILCCLLYAQNTKALTHTLWLACAAATAYLLVAISHLVSGVILNADLSVIPRLPGFSNIRFFGHWQTWTLPLIGALPVFRRHLPSIPTYWLWVVAIGWWFLFYIAAGRGTALATALGAITVLTLAPKASASWFKTLILTALLGNLLGWLWISYESTVFISSYHADGGILSTSSAGRYDLWKASLHAFVNAPWLGHGAAQFASAIAPFTARPFGSPHNYLLLWLVEYGVLGTAPLIGALCFCALRLLKGIKRLNTDTTPNTSLTLAVFSACLAALVHGLFSGIQLAPYSQLWLIVIVGTAIQQLRGNIANDFSVIKSSTSQNVLVFSLICILLIGVWLCVINPELPDPWSGYTGHHYPRLWSHSSL